MILRQVSANANRRACWALIPQIEHARLAHDLAANWHGLPLDNRLLQEMVLPTIAHHDDGWSAWDAAPQIDPTSGRPYSFLDMPHEESLKIWTKSIDAVESIGPLAQWLVAQHFSQLLASASGSNESSAEESEPIAKQWIAEQAIKSEDWQARWQENYSTVGANNRAACVELAEQALRTLQFFDRLSLWFCCREQPDPLRIESPTGPISFRQPAPGQVLVSNWPFQSDGFSVSAAALRIEARPYSSQADLALAVPEIEDLGWGLVPW